jgi:hypothetical protein
LVLIVVYGYCNQHGADSQTAEAIPSNNARFCQRNSQIWLFFRRQAGYEGRGVELMNLVEIGLRRFE